LFKVLTKFGVVALGVSPPRIYLPYLLPEK
jgi:hypothetical protein